MEVAAAVAAAEARPKRAASGEAGTVETRGEDDGMRAREGWARMELAKLCLTEVAPDHVRSFGSAINNSHNSEVLHPLGGGTGFGGWRYTTFLACEF